MGTSYSARVFFGTYARRGTKAGELLEQVIDGDGGAPASLPGVTGAKVDFVGACMTGEIYNTIELEDTGASFDRDADEYTPTPLNSKDKGPVLEAMRHLGIAPGDVAEIGWYFAGVAI